MGVNGATNASTQTHSRHVVEGDVIAFQGLMMELLSHWKTRPPALLVLLSPEGAAFSCIRIPILLHESFSRGFDVETRNGRRLVWQISLFLLLMRRSHPLTR